MAKTRGTVQAIKAKPNERGRTSHLPLVCSVPKCDNDFYVAKANRLRYCHPHFEKPPQASTAKRERSLLRKLGLI